MRAPPSSIRFQLAIVLLLLGGSVLAFSYAIQLHNLQRKIEAGTLVWLRSVAASSAQLLERELGDDNPRAAEAVVSQLGAIPDFRYTALVDDRGRVLLSTRSGERGRSLESGALAALLARGPAPLPVSAAVSFAVPRSNWIVATAPVKLRPRAMRAAGESHGVLQLAFDNSNRLGVLTRQNDYAHLVAALLGVFGLLVLSAFLDHRVTRPALRIAAAAERFAAGDRAARTGLEGGDELGRAGRAFDGMAAEIEGAGSELARARALLDAVLRTLPVGVAAVDRATQNLLFANARWRELFATDLPSDAHIANVLTKLRLERGDGTPYSYEELAIPRVLATGRAAGITDLVYVHRDGTRVPVVVSALPVSFAGGSDFDAVVSVVQDRRDLERAFREVRDWEHRFEAVVAATGQVVFDWDIVSGLVWRSGSLQTVLGYTPREYHPVIEQWETRIHPDDRARVITEMHACAREHRAYQSEYRFQHADGRWLVIRDRGFFQYDLNGHATRMLGAMSDVTEQHNLEAQLLHAQKMETVGTLAGGVAHDFNNQLTGVIGHLDLLERELGPADRRLEHVHVALAAAERCAELTRGLLAFGRQLMSLPRSTVLNAIVEETAQLLSRMLPASVQLVTEPAPELWTALADPGQIQQVLMNLCVNGRDAMPEGGRLRLWTRNLSLDSVTRRRHPEARAGEFVELGVSDTGVGIAPDILPHIFEPFFTTKPVGQGTGLGLAMVYGIVSSHHGWIEVESSPAGGTAFRVLLPRAGSERDLPPLAPPVSPGGRETVLVVDDERVVRELAQRTLAAGGYRVLAAGDGEQALRIFCERRDEIDAVLLDLTMPGRSGKTVLREILALNPETRVVLSSGYPPERGTPPGFEEAAGFLSKPYASAQLLAAVRMALDQPKAQAQPNA